MTLAGGGPIVGRSIIQAVDEEREAAVGASDARAARAALDEAELREVEAARYYGEAPAAPAAPRAGPIRRLVGRLLRR